MHSHVVHTPQERYCTYPEFDEEESVPRSLLKQVLEASILFRELVSYVENIDSLGRGQGRGRGRKGEEGSEVGRGRVREREREGVKEREEGIRE